VGIGFLAAFFTGFADYLLRGQSDFFQMAVYAAIWVGSGATVGIGSVALAGSIYTETYLGAALFGGIGGLLALVGLFVYAFFFGGGIACGH
jgi:hypothetical protein